MTSPKSLALILLCSLPSAAQTLTASSMEEDFDILKRAIMEAHGGLYRYNDHASIDQHFARQRAKLTDTNTRYEFIAVISETLAGLRDGHMRLEYDQQTTGEIGSARMLPLRLAIENSKLVVVFNDTKRDTRLSPGMEIVSINDRSVATLLTTILRHISGDGYIETGKLHMAARNFAMYHWLLFGQEEQFKIVGKHADGTTVTATLTGVTNGERSSNRNSNSVNAAILKNFPTPASKNIRLKFYKDQSTAWLRIGGFLGGDFREQLDSAFKAINDNKTKSVILDLRGNGGGVDSYGAYLVSQFTDKPFRYFERIHLRDIDPSFTNFTTQTNADLRSGTVVDPAGGFLVTPALHPQVGAQQPAQTPFKGKLVVLLDGGTFSTAADVTATLHNMKRGVFVGVESGGGYEGNTSGLNARVTLPNSNLNVKVQMYDYWNAVTTSTKGRGTLPDYPVENRVSEIIEGEDSQLARALKLAR